uniref:Muscle M-line assembly protein unc-89-like n=1 Tax=Astyanax mexicanus TaxID=7994 RepID=W5LAE6_ASTMX
MASKSSELPEGELIKLIYRHLKENGHKKAANVLRKDAPQVKTKSVKVSLNDLFKKWMSENNPQGTHAGIEQTKSSGSKSKKATSVKRNTATGSKKKLQMTAGSGNQKKKRTKKKEDSSPAQGQTDLTPKSPTAEDDSDSDSSLDVEKWKRLAFELSDVDIAKLDPLTPSNSTGKKRKPAQAKKETSKDVNAKPSAKKTRAKTSISPSKTKKTDKPSKPRSKKTSTTVTADKVKTPSKNTKDKSNLLEMDISNSLSEQAVIPKADGLSGNDSIKHKKKKLKNSEKQCESNNTETGTHSLVIEKPDNKPSEPKLNKTTSKKGKSKINKSLEPVNMDTPSKGVETPVKKVKLKKSVKAVEDLDTPPNQLDTGVNGKEVDQISDSRLVKTPSKKDKSKRKKSLEAGNVDTPSKGAGAEMTSINSESKKSKKTNGLPNGKPVETPVKKIKFKKSGEAVEAADLDTPIQADTGVDSSSTIVNQSEKNNEFSDSTLVKTPSKKAKSKKSAKPVESGEVNTPSAEADAMVNSRLLSSDQSDQDKASGDKTPSKKTKSKKDKKPVELNTPSGEDEAEEVSSLSKSDQLQSPSNKPVSKKAKLSIVDPGAEEKLSKKEKAKKTDSTSELNQSETPSKIKELHTDHTHPEKVTPAVTPSKSPKHLTSNNLSEAPISETPVKKSKTKKSPELNQAVTPSNEASLDTEEADKTKSSSKKRKSKKLNNEVQSDETSSGIINQNTASEEMSCPDTQHQHKEKKRKRKDEEGTVSVNIQEESPEPKKSKKDKKKKKERHESQVEEVAPTPEQPEQTADSLASNPERKKKKKKKDKDREKSLLSSPTSEEEPPKKKKKSSKEKEDHITDVTQEGHI